ncbi:MAG: RNA pseudouridine synthase [Treponema sp.]|jgi:23S rRNA pseudouridine1911/1915/1917 synthase|nr:RNA pseudouridine synthase [Treponema sp.]
MIKKNNDAPPLQSRILYRNAACIVINKIKGEAVEGAGEGMGNLPLELAAIINGEAVAEQPKAVHRLDVPVTGCALFGLTKPALAFLSAAFDSSACGVEKQYWAIVEKPLNKQPESGELVHWIKTDANRNKSYAHNENGPGRKEAILRYRITGEGRNYLFVTVDLVTGRHHQIRAQLAQIGLHVKGDLKYGAKRSEKDGGIRLHARSLSFPDPLNKSEKITVIADPPQIDNLWEQLTATQGCQPLISASAFHCSPFPV